MDEQEFRSDLANLTATILKGEWPDPEARLGDVIAHMAKENLLLTRKKTSVPGLRGAFELSSEARDYLNALQTEKFTHCRLCYHMNSNNTCQFHKKYMFNKPSSQPDNTASSEYVDFLNSEMGIISYVELYYTYLSLDFWKLTAKFLFRDLTGFDSVKSLLEYYSYNCDDSADKTNVETMDTE
ncbi:ac34 [Sucra jujuba nucleopolyhedrovirus]|uniref:Ac34 n=1 Tax=Sucra jujuba nucleopolyhedrovirus TaxID=1563660 RepID=A0A097P8W2_9ABAC|nr:ac34 [Sucra jujuba nucleopolyhedrovirus]AIU41263.1 ac34 [Sucra jujuba nucleopolyhedrovirus]